MSNAEFEEWAIIDKLEHEAHHGAPKTRDEQITALLAQDAEEKAQQAAAGARRGRRR